MEGKDVKKSASNNEQLSFTLGHNSVNTINGRDHTKKTCLSYWENLHPFLTAAADSDNETLWRCVNNHRESNSTKGTHSDTLEQAKVLLTLSDRYGSSAKHCVAGGSHIDFLYCLLQLHDTVFVASLKDPSVHANQRQNIHSQTIFGAGKKICRRQDGKTSLHYASRYGDNNCIDHPLSGLDAPPVDVLLGDGTTITCFESDRVMFLWFKMQSIAWLAAAISASFSVFYLLFREMNRKDIL